jgi:predicted PurR-regulated permease PerM
MKAPPLESDAPRERRTVTVSVRSWWTGAAIASATLLVWIVVARGLAVFLLLFAAALIGEGLRPAVDAVSRRMPRPLGVGLVFLGVVAVGGIAVALLVQPVGLEAVRIVDAAPGYVQGLQARIVDLQRFLQDNPGAQQVVSGIWRQSGGWFGFLAQRAIGGPFALAAFVSDVALLLLMSFFWMLAADEFHRFVVGLFPQQSQALAGDVLREMGEKLSAYMRGVAITGLIIAVLSTAGIALVRAPYALVLGLFAGLLEALPFIGPLISGAVAVLVTLASAGWITALEVAVVFVIVQQIEGNVLSPIVFNRQTALNPLAIVFATVLGGSLLGVPGAVLAVPAASLLQVMVARVAAPALRRASSA